jgi:DNA repair protein RadC
MTSRPITSWPVRERPRERLLRAGPEALADRELLAILIGSGVPGASAAELAAELLVRAGGSLRRLSGTVSDQDQIAGVGPAVRARIGAALELGRRLAREGPAERAAIRGPRDVFELCAPAMRDLRQEEFRVLLLNTQHAVRREIVVTRGTLDGSLVHPREVFRAAIAEGAAAVVLVHNHPSGDPAPSPDDRAVTAQLADAGRLLGIAVVDHVIIGDARYTSFVEAGLLSV